MPDREELYSLAGIDIEDDDTRSELVWDMLERRPDVRDKRSGEIVEEGRPHPTRLNLRAVLEHDPVYRQQLAHDTFTGRMLWQGRPVQDCDETEICLSVARRYGFELAPRTVGEVVATVARMTRVHPVREYLDRCADAWDGMQRIDDWMHYYLGADPSPLHAAIGSRWMLSAVARATEPGCKVDTVLILVGPQGALKSMAFRTLARGGWFSDTAIDLRNKDALMALQGVWIYEFAELDSMRRRESTAIKAFLSAQEDHFRPPYGRHMIDAPRQCVIVGTTNEEVFLADSTGSRRFWPVRVGEIDLAGIEEDRDQLWGEAVHRYRDGEQWWLTEEMELRRAEQAQQREHGDPWAELVERAAGNLASSRGWLTIPEILGGVLEKDSDRWTRADEMRIADILSTLGWRKGPRRRWMGARCYPWMPPEEDGDV